MSDRQTVDPAVTRVKFDREVGRFRAEEAAYRRRGILLQAVNFPTVTIAFCAAKLSPPPLLGAIRIDFTDYDLRPASVRFVHPLTHEDLVGKELTMQIARLAVPQGMTRETLNTLAAQGLQIGIAPLVLADTPDAKPFLCLPGVREYHDNPAHTGDSWLLHRASGEGCLAFIVDNIWKYGPNTIERYHVQIVSQAPGMNIQTVIDAQEIKVIPTLASMVE